MNNEFNGMVKASSQKLENAIAKFDAYKEAAFKAKQLATQKAKEDKIIVRSWLFFKKEVTVWESLPWCSYRGKLLGGAYPEIFNAEQKGFLFYNVNDMDSVKALVSINSKEVYLSATQASLVNKWCEWE
jgi:hypothetical protein